MSEVPERVVTLAEGAALARAAKVDREHAQERGGNGHFHETACLNCDTPLTGNYCANCGQAAHLHRTFGAFLHDLLHGVLHFEGKTWRTLPMLALRPGRLTREYIEGKRARYVSPMAVFLFSIFVMFAVFQIAGAAAPSARVEGGQDVDAAVVELRDRTVARRDEARAAIAATEPGSIERTLAETALATAEEDIAKLDDAVTVTEIGGAPVAVYKSGNTWLDEHVVSKWQHDPKLMLYKLQSNGYKFSWLLIPLSLPFVWLLFFWKRGIGLYDHSVFVTYSIAFMSMGFVTLSLLGMTGVPEGVLTLGGLAAGIAHIFAHLKGAYSLGRWQALWRTVVLLAMIGTILLLFLIAIGLIGAMG